jgi:respiratory burst oxidase
MTSHEYPRELFQSPASGQYASFDGLSNSYFENGGAMQATEHQNMSKMELVELRDYLVKTSVASANETPKNSFTSLLASAQKLQPLAGGNRESHARDSHFVSVAAYNESVTSIQEDEEYQLTSSGKIPLTASGKMGKSNALLPSDSVAVLIDAVRASVLPDDEKTRVLFELFDTSGCGVLTREGVTVFIEATLLAGNLETYGGFEVKDIVNRLFAGTADSNCMTGLEFEKAFKGIFVDVDGTPDESVPMATPKAKKGFFTRLVKKYRTHASEVNWLTLYVLLMVAAFMTKAYYVHYDPATWYWPKIAKGFAQIVMVNTFFLLLPMCRNFVAFLRRFAAVSSVVPVDQNIEFHKICGVMMILASLLHSVAWICIVYQMRTVSDEVMATSRFRHLSFIREKSLDSLLPRIPIWTGVVMLLITAIAGPLTHARIRRGNFNAFWMTHMLFVPFLALIVVHGVASWVQPPQAYFWVMPPLILYGIEKRYRVSNVFGGQTKIIKATFSGGTCAIFMEKPDNFHYHPGMYMFVNVPVISRFEWHPFTISSAPEDDYLSVHIRNAGDWTDALHKELRKCTDRAAGWRITRASGHQDSVRDQAAAAALLAEFPSIFIDGPVGAPSQDYYRYESVVFVGAGIGVTPFASILQSIVHQWDAFRCEKCNHIKMPKTFKLKKIYFYWITRDQEALTWFAETMNRLSALDVEGRLEIHNYFSPLKDEAVIKPLHAVQKFIHDSDGRDIISGLTTKQLTHFGRPDWQKELTRIATQQDAVRNGAEELVKKDRVGVFFCGPKPMGNQIRSDTTAFNLDEKRQSPNVVFDFHSENF